MGRQIDGGGGEEESPVCLKLLLGTVKMMTVSFSETMVSIVLTSFHSTETKNRIVKGTGSFQN